ncbi:MAG: hypothetical protein GY854_04960 [Deltaproteobacteria bacterium]|nr:hypothetical protein [Deltaproteobacteria bacterium]
MNDNKTSLVSDMLCMLPGWFILLMIDPFCATAAGIPTGALLIAARRNWWAQKPVAGRVVVGVTMPLIALFATTFAAFGSAGPFLGMLVAAATLAVAEGWNRRFGRTLIRRYPLATGILFLSLSAGFSTLFLETWVTPYPTEDVTKALSAAPDAPKWSTKAKAQAVEAVRRVIESDATTTNEALELYEDLNSKMAELTGEKSPNGVFVTLYEKSGYRARGAARDGRDSLARVLTAAADAVKNKPRKPRSGRSSRRRWSDPNAGTHVQIDVLGPPRSITYRLFFHIFSELLRNADRSLMKLKPLSLLFNLAFEIEIGVDGIEISREDKDEVAVMLPSDPVTYGWMTPRIRSAPRKIRGMIRRTWRRQFKEDLDMAAGNYTIRKFRTASFGEPRSGEGVVDWFRGNTLLGKELERAFLVERTILAADWLSRQVNTKEIPAGETAKRKNLKKGQFHYEVYPPYMDGTKDYNLPRHAGSIYGLFAIYRAAKKEPAFKKAGRRALDAGLFAIDYVKNSLGSPDPKRDPNALCFLGKKGNATSGSTALAAMAVAELPEPSAVDEPELKARVEAIPVDLWLERMGDCMLTMIDSKGAVFHNYKESQQNEHVEKEPLYFPGEVMLALVRIYKRLKIDRFLAGAKNIGDRQQGFYRLSLFLDWAYPGDHWIIQAQSELTQVTGDPKYAELSVLMGRGYLREQFPPQEYIFPDYRGAYRRIADLPRTTRAASRGEALGGAMDAARAIGQDSSDFEDGLIEGARHLLEQQFVMENSYFIPEKFDVEGGIRMGLVDNHLRIDNNQHGLVALLRALEAIDYQAGRH